MLMLMLPLCRTPSLSGEMVRQARVLAQATSDLVNAMRSDAEAEVDLDNSKKLLAAAKLLADATARMVEAAKVSPVPDVAPFFHFCSILCNLVIHSKGLMSCKINFLPNNVSYLSVNFPEVGVGKAEFFDLAGTAFHRCFSETYHGAICPL